MTEKQDENSESAEEGTQISSKLLALLMLGFAVIIVGIILIMAASLLGGGSASAGGVIFIGPFPIVFGAGPDAAWLITISLIISVVMILVFMLMRRRNSSV